MTRKEGSKDAHSHLCGLNPHLRKFSGEQLGWQAGGRASVRVGTMMMMSEKLFMCRDKAVGVSE